MTFIIVIIIVGIMYMMTSMAYKGTWNKGFEASVTFETTEAFEGDSILIRQCYTNNKRLPLPLIKISFYLSKNSRPLEECDENLIDNEVISAGSYKKIDRLVKVDGLKRGYYRIPEVNASVYNLFMTEKFEYTADMESVLYVYPQIIEDDRLNIVLDTIVSEFITSRYTFRDPFSVKGMREYMPFDTMKSINWKASAKMSQLIVNEYEFTAGKNLKIILNMDRYGTEEETILTEESIKIAAAVTDEFVKRQIPVGFITNGCDCYDYEKIYIDPKSGKNHAYSIKRALCRVMTVRNLRGIEELLNDEMEQGKAGDSMYVLISAGKEQAVVDKCNEMCKNYGRNQIVWINPVLEESQAPDFEGEFLTWEVSHE